MNDGAEKRATLLIWMIWLSLSGVIVSSVMFTTTVFDIIVPSAWLCMGIFPLAVLGVVLRFVIGRTVKTAVPGIAQTDGFWLAALLLSSTIVWMFNSPPSGWRRGDVPFIRVYERGEFEMSSEWTDEIEQRFTRAVSWMAFTFYFIGACSWRNLAVAEADGVSATDMPRKVKRRRIYNRT